ncbi:hypothetical protein D3C81_1729360 [compost metagenome]
MALAPLVHQHAFFSGAFGDQQGAVMACNPEVLFDLLGTLLEVIDELPALM